MTRPRPTSEESGLLLHALCERVANDVGARVLAIKGPVVAMQGLRASRPSADIDLWVHPDDLDGLVDGLRRVGWYDAVAPTSPRLTRAHSVNLLHDHWPLGIDVHHYFPGFLAPDRDVFDALWARRATYELAQAPVTACDPVSQVAVVGLHLLREDPEGRSARVQDLVTRAHGRLGDEGAAQLLALARETDCVVPLRPVLTALGLADAATIDATYPDELASWWERGCAPPGTVWGRQLRETPWWRWPGVLKHSIMLTDAEVAVYYRGGDTRLGQTWARLRRLRKVVRLLPGILRGLLRRPPGHES